MKDKYIRLIVSISIPLSAGLIGSYFTFSEIYTWYSLLNKPFFNPPNWIFGPVWTVLYILMGISFFMVWSAKKSKSKNEAMKLFIIQMILNTAWSIVFFGLHSPFFALLNIIALWVLILLTISAFTKISKKASYILYPYLLWVSFASILNLSIVLLN